MPVRNNHTVLSITITVILMAATIPVRGQTNNCSDTFFLAKKRGLLGKIGKALSVEYDENVYELHGFQAKNNYLDFEGKTIQSIKIRRIDFAETIADTAQNKKTLLTDLANAVHINTKKTVIQKNLFFKIGSSLNPFLMADNERFLRELPYLQDATIVVTTNKMNSNNVDITVLYKDVFPIGADFQANGTNVYVEAKNDNMLGLGDKFTWRTYYDIQRKPQAGIGIEYAKRNIKNTFINWSIGYENMGSAFNSGRREETNAYTRLELPLVSPYARWTGMLEIAKHATNNIYLNDSVYFKLYDYSYNNVDGWLGLNVSNKSLLEETVSRKKKRFVALRFMNQHFSQIPEWYQKGYFLSYSNHTAVIASFNLFKQTYYRNNFIYGFGRNEDIPEGFNYAFLTGWSNRNNASRPYMGIDVQRNFFSSNNHYYNYSFRAGGFYHNGSAEDAAILLGLEAFTSLKHLGNSPWYIRHFLNGSITHLFNRSLLEPLRLNSNFGLPNFTATDSLNATGRFSISCETVFYNTSKWVGFRFAPFMFGYLTYFKQQTSGFSHSNTYAAVGIGCRSRNENLVLGTMEAKITYYPQTLFNMNPWNFSFRTDLRFKYNSQFIKRPEFVGVN